MRKLFAAAFLFLCASAAYGQGAAYTAGPFNTSGPLYVCTTPVTTTPCSSFASLFSNAALSSAISNPFPMTAGVAITFYVTPGQYAVQMPNAGFSQIVTIGGGSGAAFSALTPGVNTNTTGAFTFAQTPAFSSSGFFDQYGVSLPSTCSPSSIYTALYVTGTNTDGFFGCVTEGVGGTNQQENGLSGYASTSCNSSSRTVCNGVGVFGLGYCTGNHCAAWGMNSIVSDAAAVTADNMESMEVDTNIFGSPSYITGLQLSGVSHAGAVFPPTSAEVDLFYNGPALWPTGIHVNANATAGNGLWLDGAGSTNGVGSQTLKMTGYNSTTAQNWGDVVDSSGIYHLTGPSLALGPSIWQLGSTTGSLDPYANGAPVTVGLAYGAFLSATSVTSPAVTLVAGDSYVVGVQSGINGANSITGITDTRGNTYKRLSSGVTGTRDMEFWVAPCIVFPGTGATITATQGSSNALGFYVWQVQGLNCNQPLGISSSSQVGTATSTAGSVPSITTTSTQELMLVFNVSTAANTFTVGSGYTLDQGASSTSLGAEHQVFATAQTANTAPFTLATSTTWWQAAISLQTAPQLGVPAAPWPSVTAGQYQTGTNCAVNSASPAACGSAAAGAFVIPTTTTAYTVNTTAVTANSVVLLTPRTYTGNLPSAPTCVVPTITAEPVVSAIVAGTSFTLTETSTTGQTCWNYWVVN